MRLLRRLFAGAACLAAACSSNGALAAPLRLTYLVAPRPAAGSEPARTDVTLQIRGAARDPVLRLQMPTWSPGDYHRMDHARYVRGLRAADGEGSPLAVAHPDPNTWELATAGADAATVSYWLPNTPRGYFSENVQVARRHAFYNGPATFVYVEGHLTDPIQVRVVPPSGWESVVSPLPQEAGPPGAWLFRAEDYDTLADSPLLVGACAVREFEAAGRPHRMAFFGAYEGLSLDRYVAATRRIVEEACRLMGGAPYARYVFFLDMDGRGGGLEHANSCRIAIGRGEPFRLYPPFVAHEFFHVWNVKRIRPAVLGPFDYIDPPRTADLWFAEGVTEYYAGLLLRRSGLWADADYLTSLSRAITALQRNPARLRVTAAEASLRVWESGDSEGYGGLSYYLKGELIGLCLDLEIRERSGGERSLDDVMRDLLARCAPPRPGYAENGIRDAVVRAGGPALGDFYDRLCRTTDELPLAGCLSLMGLRLDRQDRAWTVVEDPSAEGDRGSRRRHWLMGGAPGG